VLVFVLLSLTTYRVTRLLVSDKITESVRERVALWAEYRWQSKHAVVDADDPEWKSKLAYFITCPWCVSIWVGGFLVLAADMVTSVPLPALTWAATSAVTGWLASHEG
jgi:hypothetical protein